MNNKYDFYIDESCHLENDKIPVMCIGYIKVPVANYTELQKDFKQILAKHNQNSELKWNKFSNARTALYKELVDYFFQSSLQFRCVLVKYKERLNHTDFNQGSHDNFYYKMIYFLLHPNNSNSDEYRVFIDVKDTRGREKLRKINEVFHNEYTGNSPFKHFQHLHSHDNLFFQLADFFIGAITYKTRVVIGNITNPTQNRLDFIKYLEAKSGFNLEEGTEPWETKFNIFDHQPKVKL